MVKEAKITLFKAKSANHKKNVYDIIDRMITVTKVRRTKEQE